MRNKSRGIITAHYYKECGKGVLRINKINNLQPSLLIKSVIRFESIGYLLYLGI
jgi:hypothetical protein